MGDFAKLEVWRVGHSLVLGIYRLTRGFPVEERYGLSTQLRRASISVTSNIAEGCGRNTPRELVRFLRVALGSASEVQSQLIVARDLGYLAQLEWATSDAHTVRIKQMLSALIKRIETGRSRRTADSG